MPLALALGLRLLFLVSLIILTCAGLWYVVSTSLASHITSRNIMSLVASQSEALSPLMIWEVLFLHECSRKLTWFILI